MSTRQRILFLISVSWLFLIADTYAYESFDTCDSKGNYYNLKDEGFYMGRAQLSYNAVLYGEDNQTIYLGDYPKFWLHRYWITLNSGIPGKEEELRKLYNVDLRGRRGIDAKLGNMLIGISDGNKSKWLHEFDRVSTNYLPGRVIYNLQDGLFSNFKMILEVIPSAKDKGYLVKINLQSEADSQQAIRLYWTYGGIGWMRSPPWFGRKSSGS